MFPFRCWRIPPLPRARPKRNSCIKSLVATCRQTHDQRSSVAWRCYEEQRELSQWLYHYKRCCWYYIKFQVFVSVQFVSYISINPVCYWSFRKTPFLVLKGTSLDFVWIQRQSYKTFTGLLSIRAKSVRGRCPLRENSAETDHPASKTPISTWYSLVAPQP